MKVTKIFYDWASPPARTVLTLANMLGANPNKSPPRFQFQEVRLTKNDHLTEEFIKINPAKQIPALLESDGFTLAESHTINKYLIETSDQDGIQDLYPRDSRARAKVDEYLDWNHSNLRLGTNRYVFMKFFTKLRGVNLTEDQLQYQVSEAENLCLKSLDRVTERLERHRYVASD